MDLTRGVRVDKVIKVRMLERVFDGNGCGVQLSFQTVCPFIQITESTKASGTDSKDSSISIFYQMP